MSFFLNTTTKLTTDILISYLHNSDITKNKYNEDSNLYKFYQGIATSKFTYLENLNLLVDAIFIKNSTDLLSRFEKELSIPDNVFVVQGGITDRQKDVIVKKYYMNTNTTQTFIDIASVYGITINIRQYYSRATFPVTFPMVFAPNRNIIEIEFTNSASGTFPLPFPIPFKAESDINKIKRIYAKIKPANSIIVYKG